MKQLDGQINIFDYCQTLKTPENRANKSRILSIGDKVGRVVLGECRIATVTKVEGLPDYPFYRTDRGVCYSVEEGLNSIEELVASAEAEYNNGWIPCSERLPEESLNSVLGWDEYRKRCCFVEYLGGRWILGNDIDSVKITAWQPLPEPPQKGE